MWDIIDKPVVTIYKNAYAGLSRQVWMPALVQFVNRAGTIFNQ